MEYAEDDDPVVATFDVFHADALSQGGSLHLFQYPLRSDSRPYELNSLQMFVTSGELTSGDDPRGGIASSSSQQQTATVGQAAGARVIQPTSRVLLACALDTFPHAESFSSATTTPATGRYNNNTSSHHGDSVSASSDIARRQRLLHQLQQQQGDIGGVVKREMDDMDFNSADLEAYQQKQQYAAVPAHDGGGAAQANRYRFALHSEPFTPRSEYAVGVFSDGALHLTSIATVQQFTPVVRSQHQQRPSSNTSELGGDASSSGSKRSAAHPSASVAALSREAEGLWVDDEHCSRKPEDCFQAGPIADMVQRQLRRQRSFAVNTDAATIRAVDYFRSSTVESRVIAKRLLAPHTQRSFAGSGVTSSNAAAPTTGKTPRVLQHTSSSGNNLFPQEHIVEHGATVRKEFLLRYAHEVPLVSQVRDLMQSSQVMTFDSLMRLLVPPTTTGGAAQAARATSTSVAASAAGAGRIQEDDVLSALRGCAMYIHGRWVAKSNDREFRGNSAAMREVVLLKFWQSADGCVKREDINRLVPNRGSSMVTTIKTILESVAVLVGHRPEDRKWRLKGYAATTTSATTSGSATNEESLVDDTEALAAIKLFEQRYPAESQFQASVWTKRVVPIQSHVATLDSGKVCRNLFLVSSSSTAATTSSSGSGLSALGGSGLTPSATSSTSSGNRSASPSKTTTTDPQSDPAVVKVRNYTRRLFIEHGVINKQRAKELIARARQEQFPEASNAALSIAVQLEVQQFTASTWMLKQLHESEVDTFRPYLLAAMMELDNFESRVVVQKATEAYHRRLEEEGRPITDVTSATANIPQRVVQRVLSEAAIYRSAERLWHIKSGNLEQQ